jgi:hypothetical protein
VWASWLFSAPDFNPIYRFNPLPARIIRLLADREFVGKDWFAWLRQEGIGMTIRIKKSAKVSNRRGELVPVQQLFWSLKVGETQRLEGIRTLNGVGVYLSALYPMENC